MNVDILESNPDWRWYLLFMGSFLFLTTAGWLFAKYFEVTWSVKPAHRSPYTNAIVQVESWIEAHVGDECRAWLGKENM